ncbi:MAG TPA: hypothetical protein VL359_09340 [bacterium]|nr:hypothetical protein [bacterium]
MGSPTPYVAPILHGERLRVIVGISFVAFPLMLLAGFLAHPHLLSLERVTDAAAWTARFHHNFWFHAGHLLVMFSTLPIAVVGVYLIAKLDRTRSQVWGVFGGAVGLFGDFILAVDKGSLTLPLTAFDALTEDQFATIAPALQAILERRGALALTYLLACLPVGFALVAVGLVRARLVPLWQGLAQIVGLLLLLNPDINPVSAAGALLLCIGYLPMGWNLLRQPAVKG